MGPTASGCARPTRLRLPCGRAGRPRELASLRQRAGFSPARSSESRAGPRPCSSRHAEPTPRLGPPERARGAATGVKPHLRAKAGVFSPGPTRACRLLVRRMTLPSWLLYLRHAWRERTGGASRERAFEHARGTRTAPRAGHREKRTRCLTSEARSSRPRRWPAQWSRCGSRARRASRGMPLPSAARDARCRAAGGFPVPRCPQAPFIVPVRRRLRCQAKASSRRCGVCLPGEAVPARRT